MPAPSRVLLKCLVPRVEHRRAALLAIGDEVLRGEVANSNAAFLSGRLFEAGLDLREHVVVSDDPTAIRSVLVRLRAEVDVIVATGGLGPTEDDRTVDTVADLLGVGTVADQPSLDAMKKRFSTHGFELTPNNLRQVRIPTGAQALLNAAGIAPGFQHLARRRARRTSCPACRARWRRCSPTTWRRAWRAQMTELGVPPPAVRTWHVYGMGESHIDHRLAGLLTGIEGATLHFRTSNPENHVKVVVRDRDPERARATLEKIDTELRKRIGPGIYAVDGDTFPSAVAKSLKAQSATLAIAESCTGGLAGQLVTSEAGASAFFRGSVVCYADEIKTGVLGVKPETLADFGAVSEPCAREMAEGVKKLCGSTLAVSITGVAGPEGGRARQAGRHRLLRGVRSGNDPHGDQAVRGRSRSGAHGGGLLRAGSGAALLRYPQTMSPDPANNNQVRSVNQVRSSSQVRSFVAVPLPAALQVAVLGTAHSLAARLPDIKWSRKAENLHVTLTFLGQVDAGSAGAIHDGARQRAGCATALRDSPARLRRVPVAAQRPGDLGRRRRSRAPAGRDRAHRRRGGRSAGGRRERGAAPPPLQRPRHHRPDAAPVARRR